MALRFDECLDQLVEAGTQPSPTWDDWSPRAKSDGKLGANKSKESHVEGPRWVGGTVALVVGDGHLPRPCHGPKRTAGVWQYNCF